MTSQTDSDGPGDAPVEPARIMRGLYGDGIIVSRGAFPAAFADELRADIEGLFAEAREVEGGALPRGPHRWYVEVPPERIRGFIQIATHPWFVAVCACVLGPDYRIVEVGFDIPFPGAADQPWHRDFRAPEATLVGRRLDSLAFNLTAVDTVQEMGPLEIAPGTQWDVIEDGDKGMFPSPASWPRYAGRARAALPQRGDVSARSALTIHRGTANRSSSPRPVLVIGVDAPDATNAAHHDLQVTSGYWEGLPARLRDHLTSRRVESLQPVIQHHVIGGLLESVY